MRLLDWSVPQAALNDPTILFTAPHGRQQGPIDCASGHTETSRAPQLTGEIRATMSNSQRNVAVVSKFRTATNVHCGANARREISDDAYKCLRSPLPDSEQSSSTDESRHACLRRCRPHRALLRAPGDGHHAPAVRSPPSPGPPALTGGCAQAGRPRQRRAQAPACVYGRTMFTRSADSIRQARACGGAGRRWWRSAPFLLVSCGLHVVRSQGRGRCVQRPLGFTPGVVNGAAGVRRSGRPSAGRRRPRRP